MRVFDAKRLVDGQDSARCSKRSSRDDHRPGRGYEPLSGPCGALRAAIWKTAAHEYFLRSEQIPTRCGWRSARKWRGGGEGPKHRWRAGGMLLQFLPKAPERARQPDLHPGDAPEGAVTHEVAEDDAWVEGQSLISTVEDVELIDPDLSARRLLYRLFPRARRAGIRAAPLRAKCSCSRDAVSAMLGSFAANDRADMVKDGKVVVTCEFCSSSTNSRRRKPAWSRGWLF